MVPMCGFLNNDLVNLEPVGESHLMAALWKVITVRYLSLAQVLY